MCVVEPLWKSSMENVSLTPQNLKVSYKIQFIHTDEEQGLFLEWHPDVGHDSAHFLELRSKGSKRWITISSLDLRGAL